MNTKCGIYKIHNIKNDKVYIGQSIDIYRRWDKHRINSKKGTSDLYQDMRIYGLENFTFSIVEECSLDNLDNREIYWIKYYNSYNNGYNKTEGGQYSHNKGHMRAVRQYSLDGAFLSEFESLTEAERQTGVSISAICQACAEGHYQAGQFQWKYASENLSSLPPLDKVSYSTRRVKQYSLDGQFIYEYATVKQAAEAVSLTPSVIVQACQDIIKTCGGYIWKYSDDKKPIKITKPIIEQYDLNNNKIAEFKSLAEAHRATGVHLGNIGECCKGQRGRTQAGGYIWKYKKNIL